MDEHILDSLKKSIVKAKRSEFYKKHLREVEAGGITSIEAFQAIPFTDKDDLRNAYPFGLLAVDEDSIVRIHSSSGTTGAPVIIPYTMQDVEDWAEMFKRCYETAGVTARDRIHITPGYGLWTAGIGFQAGAEKLGAMAVPLGPGNTDKQIKMMIDLKTTVLCATSSYALLLAEEIERRGVKDKIHLNRALIGSERWGEKMRRRIAGELNAELFDIYGLTEIYGPGIGISCKYACGMHMWTDYLYYEIINPKTGKPAPKGEIGEIVITTLKKEGAPLVRYRTHDLSREVPGECPCGLNYPRIDTIVGRSDDMIKVKGVIIYPSLVDETLKGVDGVSSEYQVMIDHLNGKDILTLFFETAITSRAERKVLEKSVEIAFKKEIGLKAVAKAASIGELPRSEKKTTRIFDNRY